MKYIIIVIATALLVSISACRNDHIVDLNVSDPCILESISDHNGLGYTIEYDSIMYYAPCFNPNNSNEFVYIESRPIENKNDLFIFLITTGEKIFLTSNVTGHPKWSKNGWIVFNKNYSLYKIKDNGDSITAMFDGDDCTNPEVSPDGKKIVFCQYKEGYYQTIISDFNENILDSVSDSYFGNGCWSRDGNKISTTKLPDSKTFGYYDSTFNDFTYVIINDTSDPSEFTYDTEWLINSNQILWFSGGVYYNTDLMDITTYEFSSYCPKNYNSYPSISPDNIHLIWQKQTKYVLETLDGWHEKTSIVITDINGLNEEYILR